MIWTASEIAAALREFRGQRLIGVVDDGETVEVVFSEWLPRPNLLTLHADGALSLGGVAEPERYVRGNAP